MENNRSIYVDVIVSGQRNRIKQRALVDTGAEVSLMPSGLAKQIGAWCTNNLMSLVGIHGDTKTMPVILSYIRFSSLNEAGGLF
jgi:hypothetical protein